MRVPIPELLEEVTDSREEEEEEEDDLSANNAVRAEDPPRGLLEAVRETNALWNSSALFAVIRLPIGVTGVSTSRCRSRFPTEALARIGRTATFFFGALTRIVLLRF
tara:strand:+ start:194 stop:514 length:321 start_codon:yes stop_codon:yes gene_type:complete